MTEETDNFDINDLFEVTARDWPYDGPRNVILTQPFARANDKLSDFYDDTDSLVRWPESKNLADSVKAGNELPVGYSEHPVVELVLSMAVDDKSIPEPDYPPTIRLGNTKTVEVSEDGREFAFLKDGERKGIDGRTKLARFIKSLAGLSPQFAAQARNMLAPDKTVSASAFDNIPVVYGVIDSDTYTDNDGNEKRVNPYAWPIAAAEDGATPGKAEAGNTPASPAVSNEVEDEGPTDIDDEDHLRKLAAQATTASEFVSLASDVISAQKLGEFVLDQPAAWEKYKTA